MPPKIFPPAFINPWYKSNYPGKESWTRIVETKHITGQSISGSTLAREFPEDYGPGKEPYYPIPFRASQELYAKYKAEAEKLDHVSFIGRLGTYTYLNMDQVTAMALKAADRLIQGH